MKKIMFNDRYGLTEAALSGRKTQTRRIVPDGTPIGYWGETEAKACYNVGEVVAVAQAYRDTWQHSGYMTEIEAKQCAGYSNKMFVRADLMHHHICITNVRVERLQDISDEDCIKEGVEIMESYAIRVDGTRKILNYYRLAYRCKSGKVLTLSGSTAREVYAALIDRISGKGTWESNPYVFVYDFKLVD